MAEKNGGDKGFEVKDRRAFTADGELKPGADAGCADTGCSCGCEGGKDQTAPAKSQAEQAGDACGCGGGHGSRQLPAADMGTLVMSIATSALYHLGDIQEEGGQPIAADFVLAQHDISIIEMLKDKTKGNLTVLEQKVMDEVLYELRMRFVTKVKGESPLVKPG
ncbi:MAG: DUF1844 domain-containing protein [Myxococcota bacterium]